MIEHIKDTALSAAIAGIIILGLKECSKPAPQPPAVPAVTQQQAQAVDCSVSRETKPDGSFIDKINFRSSQAQAQKVEPVPASTPAGKPKHQFSAIATVPIEKIEMPIVALMYGQKLQFLDFDGLKWHFGPGIDTKGTLKTISGGLSYEW